MLSHIETLIGTFRDAVGPKVDICLDLNFNFKPESCIRIARCSSRTSSCGSRYDIYSPEAMADIRQSSRTPLCTGENFIYMREFLPYFQKRSADVFMVDVPWVGFSQAKKIGELAQVVEFNMAPHNYYSHLSTFISASLCGVLPNVHIMENDVDDAAVEERAGDEGPRDSEWAHEDPHGTGLGHRDQRRGASGAPLAGPHGGSACRSTACHPSRWPRGPSPDPAGESRFLGFGGGRRGALG